ncbi:MAG: Gliding motility lipoprotein GldH [Bacteroidota bacterium]|nr:MAG: Gliding motility lipoprotein GldH [Bacteroidota bacterium]
MIKTVFLIASILSLVGCSSQEELLFDEIPEGGWNQEQWVEFSYTNRLPEKEVSLNWILRHDDDYPFSNIHLIAVWRNPKGIEKTDTISYVLAQPGGRWLGKGLYIKEHHLPFVERFLLDEPGVYQFRIRPAVRAAEKLVADKTLHGIHQIGIALNPILHDY